MGYVARVVYPPPPYQVRGRPMPTTRDRRYIFKELNCDNVTYFVTVQPLTLNSVEEPTPGPSQEGNTKSPLLGGDLGVGKLLPYFLSVQSFD